MYVRQKYIRYFGKRVFRLNFVAAFVIKNLYFAFSEENRTFLLCVYLCVLFVLKMFKYKWGVSFNEYMHTCTSYSDLA